MSLTPELHLADRYRLVQRIAVGGMGEVWRATDGVLGRTVAVKVLKSEMVVDEVSLERFRAEARHTAALSHPGIAGVYDYGETTGADGETTAYLVMELVEGESLSGVLEREGRLDADRTLDVVGQTGLALQAAHDAGVIHRDVKPGNLLVRADGVVKVTDFGIARVADAAPLTRTGMVVGTAYYLSPEQVGGRPLTPVSDVYALGVVAYECLTGVRPFTGDSAVAVAMAHLGEEPPPLPASVPQPVRGLVERAMAKDPEQRTRSAGELGREALALRARLTGGPTDDGAATTRLVIPPAVVPADGTRVMPPIPVVMAPPRTVAPPSRRRRSALPLVLVLLLAGLAAAVAGLLVNARSASFPVPDVRDDSVADARSELVRNRLRVAERDAAPGKGRAGRVLTTEPGPGERVEKNDLVTLVVGRAGTAPPRTSAPTSAAPTMSAPTMSAPATVTIDRADYVGRPFGDVQAELNALGLRASVRFRDSDGEPGAVTAVEPSGTVRAGSRVVVTAVDPDSDDEQPSPPPSSASPSSPPPSSASPSASPSSPAPTRTPSPAPSP